MVVSSGILGLLYGTNINTPSYALQSLILLFLATAALYYYLLKIREEKPDLFVQFYLLTIAVKLLAYGAYLGVVIWEDASGAAANVVFFMSVYVLFTVLEVVFLFQRVNR